MRAPNSSGWSAPSVVLVLITSALIVGCETHRVASTTAPVAGPDTDADASVDVSALGATSETAAVGTTTLGGPLAGLDPALLERFNVGRDDFMEEETAEDGLGPVFN